jgi:cob(I)alamin adenosyltransferase
MSIATKTGDRGTTALIGGARVSKADLRVETYGTIDELGAAMGFARSIAEDVEVNEITKSIQRELFAVCSVVATVRGKSKGASPVTQAMIDGLDAHVARIEAMPGIVGDWVLPGDHAAAAAYDVARTICRRAERLAVRLEDEGELIEPLVLTYLNRLSDLLWLLGRLLEVRAGVDSKLRTGAKRGAKWSKAW